MSNWNAAMKHFIILTSELLIKYYWILDGNFIKYISNNNIKYIITNIKSVPKLF